MRAAVNKGFVLVIFIMVPTALQQASGEEGDFPICVISKGQDFDHLFDEDEAQDSCQALCLERNTTRYGLMKGATNTDKVGCDCQDFAGLADNKGHCDVVCGSQNYSCGGSKGDLEPFWISVYPVCDPFDLYGVNCSHLCPDHCIDGCQITTGKCIYGCKAGWEQVMCNERCPPNCLHDTCNVRICTKGCVDGKFGHDCEQRCPENCFEPTCVQKTGQCDKGTCRSGWYGAVCVIPCPANCNASTCNASGFCDGGCLDGYYGHVCSTPCPSHCGEATCHAEHGACTRGCASGWYGRYCAVPCPGTCNGSRCDNESGACSEGCTGPYFGPMCTNPCPRHCAGGLCNVTTGQCLDGCLSGWRGDKCVVEDLSGASIPGWASGTMVALFFGGAIASALVMYFVLIRQRMNIPQTTGQFRHYRLPDEDEVPATTVEDPIVQREEVEEELEEDEEEVTPSRVHIMSAMT